MTATEAFETFRSVMVIANEPTVPGKTVIREVIASQAENMRPKLEYWYLLGTLQGFVH